MPKVIGTAPYQVPTNSDLGTMAFQDATAISVDLLQVDNLRLDGNTLSSTNTNGDINLTPLGTGKVVTSAIDINGGSIDAVTIGTNSVVTDLRVDNLRLDSNTLSSTNTNGNIVLTPNGTGEVQISSNLSLGAGKSISLDDIDFGEVNVKKYNGISAWTYTGNSKAIGTEETAPTGIYFKPDGLRMFLIGTSGDDVNQYDLSTAWDVSTATFSKTFSVAAQDTAPSNVFFRPDGLRMYVVGDTNNSIFQYTLTTAWDLITANTTHTGTFSVGTQETNPSGVYFSTDGTRMFVCGSNGDDVNQYTLGTAWDITTASYNTVYSVSAYETVASGISFSDDGTRMYVTGSTYENINQFNLSTPWNLSSGVTYADRVDISRAGEFIVTVVTGLYVNESANRAYVVCSSLDRVIEFDTSTTVAQVTGTRLVVEPDLHSKSDLLVYGNERINGQLEVTGSSTLSTTSVGGTLTGSSNVTFSTTTGTINIGTSQTSGTTIVGGTNQTGTITVGRSTNNHTVDIGVGATADGNTKTVNIGTTGVSGSTTNITLGSSVSGALGSITLNHATQVNSNLVVTGNLTVNGTTTTVDSTTVTVDDPVITLGGDTAPATDDNKDRGVEFRWHNGTASKLGFFGYDDSAARFVFIPDATNASEVFSGTLGDVSFGAGTFNLGVVINETGANSDTRIEGDTDVNLFYADASAEFIGIGTNAPGEKLDVRGNLRVGGVDAGPNYIAFRGTTGDTGYTHTYIGERIYGGTESSELILFKGNDQTTASGPDRIRLIGADIVFDTYSTSTTGSFETVATSANVTTKAILKSDGKFGIGTDSPGALLDVRGNVVINEDGGNNDVRIEGDTDVNLFFTDASADNVGIGTSSPGSKLAVAGSITELYNSVYYNVVTQVDVGTDPNQIPLNQYLGQLAFADEYSPSTMRREGAGTSDLVIDSSGRVGIGTSTPASKLEVSGDVKATNFISTVANGTAPFTVASTTLVTNLNADLLDGQTGSYYLDWTNVTNKPDPIITLTGDVTGSGTMTDVGSVSITTTVGNDSHNHTSLTSVTSIGFAANASDTASISTTIDSTSTYFDFNLSDDNNADWWRWRFTPSGSTVYDAMTLKPSANGVANLTVAGEVTGSIAKFSSSQFTAADNQILIKYGATSNTVTTIVRNDSTNHYILLSDASTSVNGTWNALRPFAINLTSGLLSSSNGQDFRGGAVFNDGGVDVDFRIESDNDENIFFVDGGNDKVGIGTSTPASKLEVKTAARTTVFSAGDSTTWADILVHNPTDTLNAATGIRFVVDSVTDGTQGAGIAAIKTHASNFEYDLVFLTDNSGLPTSEVVRITHDSLVGIGTSTPDTKLHLYQGALTSGTVDFLKLEGNLGDISADPLALAIAFKIQDGNNTAQARIRMAVVNDTDYGDNDEGAGNIIFSTTDAGVETDKMIITGNGRVGVLTTNPTATLDVRGSVIINQDGGDNDVRIEGDTDVNLFFTDASADSVGIGTATPSAKLHVSGGDLLVDRGSATQGLARKITIGGARNGAGNDYATIQFQNYDSNSGAAEYIGAEIGAEINSTGADGGELVFRTSTTTAAPTERLRIIADGGIVINEGSADVDVRIEGNGDANLFFTDGGNDRVGIGISTPQNKLHIQQSATTTNAVVDVLRLDYQSTGTPANGIGVGLEFAVETSANNTEVGAAIEAVTTDVTAGSEDFNLVFRTMTAGAAAAQVGRLNNSSFQVGANNTNTTITTQGTSDLILNTNDGTNSGVITIFDGANANIELAPNGTGDVYLTADTVRVGDSNANATITTNGTGDLILNTNGGSNSGSITIFDAANGNIQLQVNGTGTVVVNEAAATADFRVEGNADANLLFADGSANNVGIGTNAPAYKLEVNGSFAATTKSFVIDHPTKPGMKLRYGSLEGPENGVYVRGKLKGGNVIELPEYWTKLVDQDSITVQLTPIGKHQKLFVEDIVDNKVIVGNDSMFSSINCFYVVFAERADVEKLGVEIDVD